MKPVLTADEFRRVDQAYSGDLDAAMDKAGFAVALAAARMGVGYGTRVSVLAGSGNNGGDGYVAARYLAGRGAHVTVHALDLPKTPEAVRAASLARAAGIRLTELEEKADADVVVDALFGGGVRDGLPLSVFPWIADPAPVVAVDFPTGLDPNTGKVFEKAFKAVETVTFGCLKTGHVLAEGPDYCGAVTVADIGISGGKPSMFIAEDVDTVRPVRRRTTHKWEAGSVLVVGGSVGMSGAAILAAKGAVEFGAGSVAIASADHDAIAAHSLGFPNFGLADATERVSRFDVVVFGPGLSEEDLAGALPILDQAKRVVVDAGGLQPAALDAATKASCELILTPHAGEFVRISGESGGNFAVRALATKIKAVVLLKGNPTRISDGGLPILVTTGGPELATIGTGDVLAGMVAAVWARGAESVDAATTGAYFHGLAGQQLSRKGPLTALDLTLAIGTYAW